MFDINGNLVVGTTDGAELYRSQPGNWTARISVVEASEKRTPGIAILVGIIALIGGVLVLWPALFGLLAFAIRVDHAVKRYQIEVETPDGSFVATYASPDGPKAT